MWLNISQKVLLSASSKNETVHKLKHLLWSLYETQEILDDPSPNEIIYDPYMKSRKLKFFLARQWKPSWSCLAFSSNTRTNNYFLVVLEPLWYLWFLTRIIHDFLNFIKGSYMISWFSYKNHVFSGSDIST